MISNLQNACTTIMERLEPYIKANPKGKWEDWVNAAYFDRCSLSTTGFYKYRQYSHQRKFLRCIKMIKTNNLIILNFDTELQDLGSTLLTKQEIHSITFVSVAVVRKWKSIV